ncbi:MAG: glutamate--tRNA ligase [Clostridia bacterium]|nr:glutamate--tRNA ligase [Clostridia bacterium]
MYEYNNYRREVLQVTVTRFAPSPTGYMHIGNLRTALYSFLISKHDGGKFILRIEDTDRERLVEGATDVIKSTLKITNITYDEGPDVGGEHGPYVQSERKEIYMEYAKKLVELGAAYYCFCTKERLEKLHEEDATGGYDRHCRNLSPEEVEKNLKAGVPFVIRQKMPLEGTTSYTDSVFGEISMNNSELQDQILMKADGYPTYNFCHVVDDYLMGVTHVVRGSEYLTSTPKYVLLYDAFGWERPVYVHLPLLMGKNEDGSVSKLSKRHGAVSFQDLVADGYLPEAVINYIALLGWCPKETNSEFFTLDELKSIFTIDGVSKSPAVFDFEKLLWFNGEYIHKLEDGEFEKLVAPFIKTDIPENVNRQKMLALLKTRISKLSEIDEKMSFFITLPDYEKELFLNKKNKIADFDTPKTVLTEALGILSALDAFDNDTLFAALSPLSEKLGLKTGAVMWCIRIAVSGLSATPGGATEIMEVIGKAESLSRIKAALAKL